MKEIPLTGGHTAIIDEEDFHLVKQFTWCAQVRKTKHRNYVYARVTVKGVIYVMHRIITNAPKGMCVDHINGNTLDNRKLNLRVCTHSENMRNRTTARTSKHGYKGVEFDQNNWRARITVNGKRIRKRGFKTAIEAAKAYDELAIKYHGEYASLNFPESQKNLAQKGHATPCNGIHRSVNKC